MLEQLRQSSRSFIIWILFGIIILVFIISFGPQANQQIGCGASDDVVMEVEGQEVQPESWRYAINGLPRLLPNYVRGMDRRQRNNVAMDLLLSRELLAQAAEDAGFRVSDELVQDKIKRGEWFFLGFPADRSWYYLDGYFSYEALERHAHNLGLQSVAQFIDEQERELLADAMRNLVISGVNVSNEEVLTAYQHDNTTATVDYVRFRTPAYRMPDLTREQIQTYLAEHEAEVKEKYEAEAVNYKGTKPSVELRQIFVAIDGEGEEAKVKAKAEAEQARAKLVGGADFDELAREVSDDAPSARRGGRLGWRRLDRPGLPDEKLAEAITKLDEGALTDIIETDRGFYILEATGKREGDLTFDQVKLELAEDMAKQHYAREAARADARAALAQLQAGATLEDLFDKEPPRFDPNMLREQLDLPPGTDVEEILEQYKKALEGSKTGSVIINGPAIPAEWQGGEGEPEPKTTPAKPAAKPKATTPAKPKTATKPKAPAAGARDDAADDAGTFKSPSDGLPRPEALALPKIQTQGPFTREPDTIPGLGQSEEAVEAAFETLQPDQVAPKVFEMGGDFVILRLASRGEPDLEDFKKRESQLVQQARLEKANDLLGDWLKNRCTEVAEAGDVSVNKTYLTEQDEKGNNLPVTYKPCQFF